MNKKFINIFSGYGNCHQLTNGGPPMPSARSCLFETNDLDKNNLIENWLNKCKWK
jgi:hypothetical protein